MAALIAAFLGWRTLSQQGPAVTISFHSADGLEPGKTRVKFKDVELGVVDHVVLSPDLSHVGEPLGAMLSRVLVENLTQRLPGAIVFGEGGEITAEPNAIVEVDVQRLDTHQSGAVVLVAQVVRRGGVTRAVRLSVQPASSNTGDEVGAMSIAVGQLADAIAGMLR